MTIRERVAGFNVPGFLHSVGVLVSGTALASAITALVLPVLTHLYTPVDFSVLAVFTALVSIISVAACLRFDVAIPMPEQDSDAINVMALALLCTLVVTTLLAIAVFNIPTWMLVRLDQQTLEPHLWLLPVGVLFAGAYSVFQFWSLRKKEFPIIAGVQVAQAGLGAVSQVVLGWLGWTPVGLIFGPTLNNGSGCLGLGYRIVKSDRDLLRTVTWSRMRYVFGVYDRFPKYSTFEALSNAVGIQLPIILIAAFAARSEAGFLLLAKYTMQGPMSLIGSAIGQVYLSRAPEEFRTARLGAFTASVFGGLVKSGVGPLIFFGIVAPELFAAIFGEGWRRAGVLASWMTPWFVMQYLAVPVSMALHVTSHQKAAFVLQLFGLIIRVGATYGASVWAASVISEAYAIAGFVFNLVYLVLVFHVVQASGVDLAREARQGLPIVLQWAAAGVGMVLAIAALRL